MATETLREPVAAGCLPPLVAPGVDKMPATSTAWPWTTDQMLDLDPP